MTEFLRTDTEINCSQLKTKRAGGLPESAGGGSQPPPDGGVRSEPKAGSRCDPGHEGVLMSVSDLQNLGHLPAFMSDRQDPEGPASTLTAREAGRKWGLLRRGPQPGVGGWLSEAQVVQQEDRSWYVSMAAGLRSLLQNRLCAWASIHPFFGMTFILMSNSYC